MDSCKDSFGTRSTLMTPEGPVTYFNINKLSDTGFEDIDRLPFSIKILLENLLRNEDGKIVSSTDIENMIRWNSNSTGTNEVPFMPARVLLQDFTGVPAVLDMAAMREAAKRLYGDPMRINPIIPAELVVDHSVQVDSFGSKTSFKENVEKEFQRNSERYAVLKWGQKNFANFQIVPPATGICHQVNIEYLARVVFIKEIYGKRTAFPDTLLGLDSHTTMVNGIGVLGWGVGGIEAEAVMLGRPYYLLIPQVVGFKLTGRIPDGTTAMDLVLTITELLRKKDVVGKFVEFYGPGIKTLSVEDRATIANMTPEYGATAGFFPVDEKTTAYLRLTGREENAIDLIENYCKEQGLFKSDGTPTPVFTETLHLDMNTIQPCLAGPSRPQERVPVFQMKQYFEDVFGKACETGKRFDELEKKTINLCHGSVVIAAITSCTNTSNPSALIGAGLLAKRAVTTDHISPAGAIPIDSPAGTYLINQGVKSSEFNSFGSRRGNHEVMIRGTFGNIRLKNQIVPGTNGGWTSFFPGGKKMTIYDAAMLYQKKETPLLVIAGREYGTGSSRDWAAKGTALLGIKAVIAESFERIHRSNLVCMGVLPLQFKQGENHETLKLKGTELFDITGIEREFEPGEELSVCAHRKDGKKVEFKVIARIDSSVERDYYIHGGILAYVLRHLK